MSKLRPYLVHFRGVPRLVNATSQSTAQNHVVKAEVARVKKGIESCRAATGADVAAFFAGGGKIETAGDAAPEPASGGLLGALTPDFFHAEIVLVDAPKVAAGMAIVPANIPGNSRAYRLASPEDDLTGALRVPGEFIINVGCGLIAWGTIPEDERDGRHEQICPGHVASDEDAKVCRHCGITVDALRPDEEEER